MMCVCAVLIVPLRFLCHCGKWQLCLPALEGANGSREDDAGPEKLGRQPEGTRSGAGGLSRAGQEGAAGA